MRTPLKFCAILFLANFLIPIICIAQKIDYDAARLVADYKISQLKKSNEFQILDDINAFTDLTGETLFYIFELTPYGFIVVTADIKLPPVIAYSFLSNYKRNDEKGPLEDLLKADLQNRLKYAHLISQEIISERSTLWNSILLEKFNKTGDFLFEQWPPEGTTMTGGWLETNWTQNAPYNNFCPMDPVTNQRSLAGCPAVALAMIINYYKTINETVFDDLDDYYHSYAGRNYWIDDDYEEIDFPSFPILNAHLDTLSNCFSTQTTLKDNEKAALTFACGTAAQQVYTSSISGTFGVAQAYNAYQRFGFTDAVLMDDSASSLYALMKQHMVEARPVHLAVVDPAGTMGHNLVIDGYNTDDYYHLNLGWGGSYNGWYMLPEEIPYGLTVIEGVILDIAYPPVYTASNEYTDGQGIRNCNISPNPASSSIYVSFYLKGISTVEILIIDSKGKLIMKDKKNDLQIGSHKIKYNLINNRGVEYMSGFYFCRIISNKESICSKFIIK